MRKAVTLDWMRQAEDRMKELISELRETDYEISLVAIGDVRVIERILSGNVTRGNHWK